MAWRPNVLLAVHESIREENKTEPLEHALGRLSTPEKFDDTPDGPKRSMKSTPHAFDNPKEVNKTVPGLGGGHLHSSSIEIDRAGFTATNRLLAAVPSVDTKPPPEP